MSVLRALVVTWCGLAVAGGCYSQPADSGTDGATTGSDTGGPATTAPATDGPPTSSSPAGSSDGETSASTDTDTGTPGDTTQPGDTTVGQDDSGSSTGVDAIYVDDDTDPTAYTRVDRNGYPFVSTAIFGCYAPSISCEQDAYNDMSPIDDVSLPFVQEQVDAIAFLRGGLVADVAALGFFASTSNNQSSTQLMLPHMIPETIKIDLDAPLGFPNGRRLADPAMDLTLGLLLLDLDPMGGSSPPTALADLPLNPPANDVPFGANFPYVAPPH